MPSPQSLVAFLVMLLVLLIASRTQFGLSPNVSAALSIAVALAVAWIVDRFVPPDEDEDLTSDGEDDGAPAQESDILIGSNPGSETSDGSTPEIPGVR